MRRRLVSRDYPFLDHPGTLAFAHRGGTAYSGDPENSMAAFQAAVKLGYRYLETDVRVTADDEVVVFHDASLERMAGGPGEVAALTYRELRRWLIGGREVIPLLSDVLTSWPQVRVNIDIKALDAVQPLVRELRRAAAFDRVCLASFSERRIRQVRRLVGPRVATAHGPLGVAALRIAPLNAVRRLLLSAPIPCLQVPWRLDHMELVTAGFVNRAHALGKQVHVWTIDDSADMHTLLDRGVDGVITNRIDVLRSVLVARGEWASPVA